MSKLSTFDDILRPYVGVMTEVKRRLGILQWALTSPELAVEEQYRIELGALELRMMIEFIAVGLLYAHGDIEATRTGQIIGNYRHGDVFEKIGDAAFRFLSASRGYPQARRWHLF